MQYTQIILVPGKPLAPALDPNPGAVAPKSPLCIPTRSKRSSKPTSILTPRVMYSVPRMYRAGWKQENRKEEKETQEKREGKRGEGRR